MSDSRLLPPWAIQIIGLLLLIAAAAFWFISDRESPLLVGAALTLIGLGAYGSAQKTLRKATEQPPEPELEPSSEDSSR